MTIILGLALGLIIGGLVICLLSRQAGSPLLVTIFWWVGVICAIIGLVLLLTPVLVWINNQLQSMIGH